MQLCKQFGQNEWISERKEKKKRQAGAWTQIRNVPRITCGGRVGERYVLPCRTGPAPPRPLDQVFPRRTRRKGWAEADSNGAGAGKS